MGEYETAEDARQILATRSVPVKAVQVEYKSSVSREMFFDRGGRV